MSKEIKKRVEDSEIETAKSSSHKASIITIIVLLFIVIGLIVFLLYDYEIIFPSEAKKTDTIKRHEEKNISIDNPNIISLYNNIHDNINDDTFIYTNNSSSTEKMSSSYKFDVAYNIYKKDIVDDGIRLSLDEDSLKEDYELIFGKGSYKRPDSINTTCNILSYDSISRSFINTSPSECNIKKSDTIHDKIISAKITDKELVITSAVVFNISTDNSLSNLCRDINCNKILTENNGDYTREKHFNDYIDANKERLDKYDYKFKLDDDGFYYYVGYEKEK